MDISFKIRLLRKKCCFLYQGFMASRLDDPPLVERQGTEAAASKASAIADQTEFDLPNSRDSASRFVAGMIISHVRKRINLIHFFLGQGFGRWILHNKFFSCIRFHKTFSQNRIRIAVLDEKAFCIDGFICL